MGVLILCCPTSNHKGQYGTILNDRSNNGAWLILTLLSYFIDAKMDVRITRVLAGLLLYTPNDGDDGTE